MRSLKMKQLGVLVTLVGVVIAFQNCAKGNQIPDESSSTTSAALSSSSSAPAPTVFLSSEKTVLIPGEITQLSASGGQPPYAFAIVSGPGSIVSGRSLVAGASVGSIIVQATDQANNLSQIMVTVQAPSGATSLRSCRMPWGDRAAEIVNHGGTVAAFVAATVAAGQTCKSQVRSCNDGTLSGTNLFFACSVAAPSACTFNGQTVASGASVTAYTANQAPSRGTCASVAQTRTCSNGVLSGTAAFATCGSAGTRACTFNGVAYNDGARRTVYNYRQTRDGSECLNRGSAVCTNGNWTLPVGVFADTSAECRYMPL